MHVPVATGSPSGQVVLHPVPSCGQ
jgi:hypothetical protein